MRKTLTTRVDVGDGSIFIGLDGLDDLECHLRYGDASAVRFVAAAVVDCYRTLIQSSQVRRNEICSIIQREAKNES